MSFKLWIKQTWTQIKSNWGYRHIIYRTYDGEEYNDKIEFIPAEQLPKDAVNIRNYGKYWFYVEYNMNPDPAPEGPQVMRATDVCTWADNNDVNKSLSEMWKWTNNIDLKKIVIIAAVAIVGLLLYNMVK